jgi:hypothetical protein
VLVRLVVAESGLDGHDGADLLLVAELHAMEEGVHPRFHARETKLLDDDREKHGVQKHGHASGDGDNYFASTGLRRDVAIAA